MNKFFTSLALAGTVSAAAMAAPPTSNVSCPPPVAQPNAVVSAEANAVFEVAIPEETTATSTATVARPRPSFSTARAASGHITLRRASDQDLPFPWRHRTAASMSRLAEFRGRVCDADDTEPVNPTADCVLSHSRASATASAFGSGSEARASAKSSVRVPSLPPRVEPIRPTGPGCAPCRPTCSAEKLTPIDQVLASLPEPLAPEEVAPAKTPAIAPPVPTQIPVEQPAPAADNAPRSSQRHVSIACVSTSKGQWEVAATWIGANSKSHRCDLRGTRREIAAQLETLPPKVAAEIREELNLPAPAPAPESKPESVPVEPQFSAPVPVQPPVVVPHPESSSTDKEGC